MIAMLGKPLPTPKPHQLKGRLAVTQTEIRRRRRTHMIVVHDGSWSLRREIADVARPFAAQVAVRPDPLQFRRPILAYGDAAHEFVGTVVGWAAERDARQRTEHLADDEGKRRYARP